MMMLERTPVISLGAGVQSSAMLLMAARGLLAGGRIPELAVFADTQWEPPEIYEWVEFLRGEVAGRIDVVTVTAGDLRGETARFASGEASRYASPPLYTRERRPCPTCRSTGAGAGEFTGGLWEVDETVDDAAVCPTCRGRRFVEGERAAILRRQCTKDYKLTPIWRELRARGYGPRRPVEQWVGISLDEVQRMKPSRLKWASTAYPLVDERLTRQGCLDWLEQNGYARPSKSACIGCPYHDDATWRTMKRDRPELFAEAVEWDRQIRTLPRLDSPAFVHRSLLPLDEVDFSNAEDRGQLTLTENDECEGGCFL